MAQDKKKKFNFIITEEMVNRAESYMPLARKVALAKTIAPDCIYTAEITTQTLEANKVLALPQICLENILTKQLYLMQIFLTEYLHIELPKGEDGKELEFSTEIYDNFARNHPLNQLERLKTNPVVKDKVFDIIADYKEFKKLLDIEIYNLRLARNDAWERALAGIGVITTPDAIQKMQAELEKLNATIAKGKATAAKAKKTANTRALKNEVAKEQK